MSECLKQGALRNALQVQRRKKAALVAFVGPGDLPTG